MYFALFKLFCCSTNYLIFIIKLNKYLNLISSVTEIIYEEKYCLTHEENCSNKNNNK